MSTNSIYGETDELVEQILDLSLRFEILTEYTAFYSDPTTSVKEDNNEIPSEFVVEQNYPNPFNPVTTIKYSLPAGIEKYYVTVKVYDALGRLISVLFNDYQKPGNYSVEFNGEGLSSGIYFYTITADQICITRKMMLIK